MEIVLVAGELLACYSLLTYKQNIMRNIYFILITICLLSCTPNKDSTIDSTLQIQIENILQNKMVELNALSAQVIVMETKTGEVKAMVGLKQTENSTYELHNNFSDSMVTGLMHPISLLATLEIGEVNINDSIDTENGIYVCNGDTIRDHNWKRGGYGGITLKEGIIAGSNIATVKTAEKVNTQTYFDILNRMSYGKPDCIDGIADLQPIRKDTTSSELFSIGYNQQIAPIQVLTFYNAIANNGKMVEPLLYKGATRIINPQIANKSNITSIQQCLIETVSKGLGKPAASNKVQVAGKQGTVHLENGTYIASFCGYFPADNPEYSVIVTIEKENLPVSGGLMAGDVFRQIADLLCEK